MDWSNFNLHGDAPARAFESLTGILFERWCHHQYPLKVSQVIFVNGAGGDGGVEAYTQMNDGNIIGLQAKWFREPLQQSQIKQIKSSLNTAANQRSGLIQYIVAVPRDLSDVRRDKKTVITERGRWNEFLNNAQKAYPGITLDLWDETRITALLAELGSEGLRRYWFDRSVTDLKYLQMSFNQAKNGWLRDRYAPDLHQFGQIEQDLKIRLNGSSVCSAWLQEVKQMRNLLEEAHVTTQRLQRYPEFIELSDTKSLIQAAQDWLQKAITEQVMLENCLFPGNSFPVLDFENDLGITNTVDLQNLINELLQERNPSQENAVDPIGRQLEKLLERWHRRKITPRKLRRCGQPVIYIGSPGVGKTDALANAVQEHIFQRKPAVLIRAKDVDLSQNWDSLLANAIGQPGWNLRQVLDALESAAIQSEVRLVSESVELEKLPVRAIIAIDGLDETTKSERWADKLGELSVLAQEYRRILFALSVRPSLVQRLSLPENIDQVRVRGSDSPLADVFQAHCKINGIQCPPALRWILRTPLAIRLFAELYKKQRVENFSSQEFLLVELIKKKIHNVEDSVREREGEDWPIGIKPVTNSLREIARACFNKGSALSEEEAMQVVELAQSPKNVLTRSQLLSVLNQCCDQGLLLRQSMSSDDPFEAEVHTWEPAYESLADFLLASNACQKAIEFPDNPNIPPFLEDRLESVTIAIYLLGKKGVNFFASELWKNDLKGQGREHLQLKALSMIPSQQGEAYRDWVLNLFSRDMPTCRAVLQLLIVPGLRIPEYIYNAKFVHEALLPMGVAERDLFWSGPHQIPHNHGARWEGYASTVLEELELAEDDPWDSAPLLLAWATTTVNNDNRRRIRSALANWGHSKPSQLLALLETGFQTNDPQMKEDLLLAAYGASCLVRPNETWLSLCEWIIKSFFCDGSPYYTHNLIVIHCARSLVERCLVCGVFISEEVLIHFHKPYVDIDEVLLIDKDCINHIDKQHGIAPATGDLAWYVVPQAIKPFFENSYFERMANSTYPDASQQNNNNPEGIDDLVRDVEILADENSESSTSQKEPSYFSHYSRSAEAILKHYAKVYNLPELTPNYFAFAFVRAYALNLGWSEDIFVGNPKGGEPDEILGADIAISNHYGKATHGEQSSISSFGEKYVWAATHELTGFLADRVTAYDWNYKAHEPPVHLSLLVEASNPATDISYGNLNSDSALDFSELTPDIELTELLQIDRVNEWIQKAPLPLVEPLLLLESSPLYKWAQDHEWLVLKAFVKKRHIDSQAESTFWASTFALPSFTSSLREKSVEDAITRRELYDFSASMNTIKTYQDPCEVVWAPWVQEAEGIIYPVVHDSASKSKTIPMQAGTCKVIWHSPDGETEDWLPAKWLRRILGIVDFHAGKFLNAAGEILAFTIKQSNESLEGHQCDVLVARRDVIIDALKANNLSLGWGVRLYREPSYPLIMLSGEKRRYQDWRGTVFCVNDLLERITYKNTNSAWME